MRKRLSVDLTEEDFKWLKIQAIKRDKTVKGLVLSAVKEYCKKSLTAKK